MAEPQNQTTPDRRYTSAARELGAMLDEALDALAAERTHAQQVEVPHSSAAVLGYSVARQDHGLRDGAWVVSDKFCTDAVLDPALIDESILEEGEIHVAVVRVDADGRIGGEA